MGERAYKGIVIALVIICGILISVIYFLGKDLGIDFELEVFIPQDTVSTRLAY